MNNQDLGSVLCDHRRKCLDAILNSKLQQYEGLMLGIVCVNTNWKYHC